MSSFDKTVRLACKPKAAPPKAKYMDPIISATYSEDGAIHDVCKALSPRFREPNAIVVFKALIVLHTMIKNGATDNVLSYLSTEDVLKLRNVSEGQWDGYNAPKNLQKYAAYLDTRIRTYKDLKHDPIRVQSDSNLDRRVEHSLDEGRSTSNGSRSVQRSKTLAGRKLRSMTVEKGLLRETKAVQRTITALLDCKLYSDNLDDELNVTALRLLVKDLLILFQASNEGVMNVLEHYFEMSHVDAETALNIYRTFCKQTERVVEYLGVAKKLQNLLNIPIPNLKFAPVSLVTALEDYLKDPNFEQKRMEYRASKAKGSGSDGKKDASSSKAAKKDDTPKTATSSKPESSASSSSAPASSSSPPKENNALVDFFSSIEENQPTMFNPVTNSPSTTYFQQQAAHNPFVQRQSMLMTGAPPQQPFIPSQPTGFVQPQFTAMPNTQFQPLGQEPTPAINNTFNQQQSAPQFPFLQTQPTGFLQPLQPQTTGSNPFRQSMLLPQSTGIPNFGANAGFGAMGAGGQFGGASPAQPFPNNAQQTSIAQSSPFGQPVSPPAPQNVPARPASTPITSNASNSFGQAMQPVVSHVTGSRNPFGVPQEQAPPVPKAPTLAELKTGLLGNFNTSQSMNGMNTAQQQPQGQPANASTSVSPPTATFPFSSSASIGGAGAGPGQAGKPSEASMSGIASSFSFNNSWALDSNKSSEGSQTASTTSSAFSSQPTGSTVSALFSQPTGATSSAFSTFSNQPTGSTSATPSVNLPSLQPQTTGFSGIKAFKPTSSFGASLLESLPPIPQADESAEKSPPLTNGLPSSLPTGLPASTSANTPFSVTGASLQTSGSNPLRGLSSTPQPPSANASASSPAPQFPFLNSQPTGAPNFSAFGAPSTTTANPPSTVGVGLRPQLTGGGIANPFRASMFTTGTSSPGLPAFNANAPSFGALNATPGTSNATNPQFTSALFSTAKQ